MTLRSKRAWFCGMPGWSGNAESVATPVAVEVGGRARVDAGVPVAVRLAVGVEPVVVGEREEPVLVVPPPDRAVDDEPVGLQDVDAVERGPLGRQVAQVEAVRAVGP